MVRLREIRSAFEHRSLGIGQQELFPQTKAMTVQAVQADKIETDGNAMTANALVCTDIVDSENEVILASGVDLSEHMANAQIWFEHAENPVFTLTLAMAEDAAGNYTVQKPDDFTITGVSHFALPAQHCPMVYTLFGLIDLGVIRGVSIHVIPAVGGKAIYTDREGNKYRVTERSALKEYSHCKIGVNPECLKKALRTDSRLEPRIPEEFIRAVELQAACASSVLRVGRVGEQQLTEPIKKSLQSMVQTGASMTLLQDHSEQETMSKKSLSAAELNKLSHGQIKSLASNDSLLEGYDKPTQVQLKSMYARVMEDEAAGKSDEEGEEKPKFEPKKPEGEADPKPEEKPVPEEGEGETEPEMKPEEKKASKAKTDRPPGSSVLEEIHGALGVLTEKMAEMMSVVEEPNIVGAREELVDQVRGMSTAIDGLHEKAYGTSFTKPMEHEEEEEAMAEEEDAKLADQLKSLLSRRGKQVENFKIIGIAGNLRRYSEDKNISEPVRKHLGDISRVLESIQKSASEQSESDGHNEVETLRSQLKSLRKDHDSLKAEHEVAVSQRKRLADRLERIAPAS